MSFTLNPDRMSYADLRACVQNLDALWKQRIVTQIPHIDAQLDFFLDAPMCRYLLIEHEHMGEDDEPVPDDESLMQQATDHVRVGLLVLEMVGGVEYIREHLNGSHPSAFLTATHDGFVGVCAELSAEDIDVVSNTAKYLTHFTTAYASSIALVEDMFLDPQMAEELPYPAQRVSDHCDVILADLRLPEHLMDTIVPDSITIQLYTEIRCDQPTMN